MLAGMDSHDRSSAWLPRIGVLGGMGPLATADFLARIAQVTPATCDQDHFPVTVDSTPQIPDRVAALEGRGADPLPALLDGARRLVAAGCDLIAMPCNTAHYWHAQLAVRVRVPVLHIVDAVAGELATDTKVGLLGTSATLRHGLYQCRDASNRGWLLPDEAEINALVTPGISAIKSGDLHTGRALLCRAARALAARGADALVLACTEIPLVVRDADVPVRVIDATLALARHTIAQAQRLASMPRAA
jgi:aspartate racemase